MSDFHPFKDMKESANAQHEDDKVNWEAAKAEGKATWEEAKLSPKGRQALMQQERDEQIAEAKKRTAEAQDLPLFAFVQDSIIFLSFPY